MKFIKMYYGFIFNADIVKVLCLYQNVELLSSKN